MPSRQSLFATFTTLAQLGYAHTFFGNLYEATAKVPHRIAGDGADDSRLPSMLSAGSPARYFVAGVPITVGSTVGALLTGWKDPGNRRSLTAATASFAAAGALTGYVVPVLNTKLFVAGDPLTRDERDRLLRTWYRLNAVRMVALGAGWLALQRVRR